MMSMLFCAAVSAAVLPDLASEADTPRSEEQPVTDTCRPGLAGGCAVLDVPVVKFSPGWPDQDSVPGRQIAPVDVLNVATDSAHVTHFDKIAPAWALPVT